MKNFPTNLEEPGRLIPTVCAIILGIIVGIYLAYCIFGFESEPGFAFASVIVLVSVLFGTLAFHFGDRFWYFIRQCYRGLWSREDWPSDKNF